MEKSLLELIERRLTEHEVGSVQHDHYTKILREMDARKLHVAEDAICGSCQ